MPCLVGRNENGVMIVCKKPQRVHLLPEEYMSKLAHSNTKTMREIETRRKTPNETIDYINDLETVAEAARAVVKNAGKQQIQALRAALNTMDNREDAP